MRLLTAHKILIGSAIVFFAFFTLWGARRAFAEGEGPAGLGAPALSAVATAGLVVYYRRRFP